MYGRKEVMKVKKDVMILTGAGQIGMAIARRMGYGKKIVIGVILSRLVDTFFSRISLTMPPAPKSHNTAYVLPWEEPLHWQSRSSGYSSS